MDKCDFECKQTDEIKDNISFKAVVCEKLENIEKLLRERKEDSDKEENYIWTAIDKIRDDIKSLYWKVGLVSGTVSLVISVIAIAVGKLIK